MTVTIYHNPRRFRPRRTVELLRPRGVEPEILESLRTPPDAAMSSGLLDMAGLEPRGAMRKVEAENAAAGLDDGFPPREASIGAMVENPIRVERAIVMANPRAAIGRPAGSVRDIV